MPIVLSPLFDDSVDESTISTGTTAYASTASKIQLAIASLSGHPYESGCVFFAVNGGKRQLASGQPDIVIPLRRSIASRDLLVELLADGASNDEVEITITHGSISKAVGIVGVGAASQEQLDWAAPLVLEGIGDGTLSTHDRTSTQPANDLVISHSSGTGVANIYAVAWTELHNGEISV